MFKTSGELRKVDIGYTDNSKNFLIDLSKNNGIKSWGDVEFLYTISNVVIPKEFTDFIINTTKINPYTYRIDPVFNILIYKSLGSLSAKGLNEYIEDKIETVVNDYCNNIDTEARWLMIDVNYSKHIIEVYMDNVLTKTYTQVLDTRNGSGGLTPDPESPWLYTFKYRYNNKGNFVKKIKIVLKAWCHTNSHTGISSSVVCKSIVGVKKKTPKDTTKINYMAIEK